MGIHARAHVHYSLAAGVGAQRVPVLDVHVNGDSHGPPYRCPNRSDSRESGSLSFRIRDSKSQ